MKPVIAFNLLQRSVCIVSNICVYIILKRTQLKVMFIVVMTKKRVNKLQGTNHYITLVTSKLGLVLFCGLLLFYKSTGVNESLSVLFCFSLPLTIATMRPQLQVTVEIAIWINFHSTWRLNWSELHLNQAHWEKVDLFISSL